MNIHHLTTLRFNKEHVSIFSYLTLNGILIDQVSLSLCLSKEMKIPQKIIRTELLLDKMTKMMNFLNDHYRKLLHQLNREQLQQNQQLMTYSGFQENLFLFLKPKHRNLKLHTTHLMIFLVLLQYKLQLLFKPNRCQCQTHQTIFLEQVLLNKHQHLKCSLSLFIQFITPLQLTFMHNLLNQILLTPYLEVGKE